MKKSDFFGRWEAVVIKNSEAEKAYVLWTFDKSWRVAEDTC